MGERLTRSDWIRHGLRTLADEGPGALKVGQMAAKLGVSRGSFYWHFKDMADFRGQLVRRWQASSTDQVIQDLDARQGEAGLLKHLMQRAFRGRRRLDRAMRAWAAEDDVVASAVAAIDRRRVARIAGLLAEAGVDGERAVQRAVFLYWAYLGQAAIMGPLHASLPAHALADIADLFER